MSGIEGKADRDVCTYIHTYIDGSSTCILALASVDESVL